LRANYPLLDAAVYIGDGNNSDTSYPAYFHADDAGGAVRNTLGIYLILPDTRGKSVRGWDPSGVTDPDGPTRKFPDFQANAVVAHDHDVQTKTTGDFAEISTIPSASGPRSIYQPTAVNGANVLEAGVIQGGPAQHPVETRMANYGVKMCVRW
jgi:hypothetical protein